MIVRKSEKGLHIIYQAAHGLLAGKIAQELKQGYRPEFWLDTLVAIVEHDDHQLDFKEKKYLSKIGVPMDFTEGDTTIRQVLKRIKRVMDHAISKSLWTAMLVSFHLEFLYGKLRDESKKINVFLGTQDEFRRQTMAHFAIGKNEAESVYKLLLFCDRCSLILCKDEIPDANRKVEINTTIDDKTYFLFRKENGNLSITPWCFEKSKFTISIEQIVVEQHKFKDQKEFEKVLNNSFRSIVRWTFEK